MTSLGRNILKAAVAAAIFTSTAFPSNIISFATSNNTVWSITGAGAVDATAMANSTVPGTISITDNSLQDGNYVSGGSTANFNGFWFADFMFFLPGNTSNVVLNFSGLTGDDRVVLLLNGTIIGYEAIDGDGPGLLRFSSGGSDDGFAFGPGHDSGTVSNTGFVIGGTNLIRLVVNNSGTGRAAATQSFISGADGTAAGILGVATVTFDTPEPGTISLMLLGIAPLAWRFRRRRS